MIPPFRRVAQAWRTQWPVVRATLASMFRSWRCPGDRNADRGQR